MHLLILLACSGSTIGPGTPFGDDTQVDPDDADGDGYLASEDDCDDTRDDVNPGRSESCDGLDNDCNGQVDDDPVDAATFYVDQDQDGYGLLTMTERACEAPGEGWSQVSGDCDDDRADVNPDGVEVCDEDFADEDCDGIADDSDESVDPAGFVTVYEDADGDGYGNGESVGAACHEGGGWVLDATDCDDTSAQLTPENECDLGWYGTYTGDFTYTGTVDSFGADSCVAQGVDVSIDPTQSNPISSSFVCNWQGWAQSIIGPQTVNFEGVIESDDSVTGGVFVGSLYVPEFKAASVGGEPAVFAGTFEGTDSSSGFTVTYTGSFSFTR